MRRKDGRIDQIAVQRREGERLEAKERSIRRCSPFAAKEDRLDPDAVRTLPVNAGLVRNHHAGLKRRGVCFFTFSPADGLRALMHVQKITDSVPGAALVVHAVLPHGLSRHDIERNAVAALEEYRAHQLQL